MCAIWSPEAKIVMERQLWIAVMRAQSELGLDVPASAIEQYAAVVEKVDLDSIAARERVTKHDVKARIDSGTTGERAVYEAFAAFQEILVGMGGYMAERATDLGDVAQRIICLLYTSPSPRD